jgi:hypothetical protein
MKLAVVALIAIGCSRTPAAPDDPSLAAYLTSLAGADLTTRQIAVDGWKLDKGAWDRLTTDPYREVYPAYVAEIDRENAAFVEQLAHRGVITARPHFAGDPKLTIGQARARWAQPVQAPSQIAEIDGTPIDAVFVRDGDHWRVIVGIDKIITERTTAYDPACARLALHHVKANCANAAWVIAEAALRSDPARLTHACAQLANLCRDP